MWLELPTIVLSTLLSLAGVGVPQLTMEAAKLAPAVSCASYDADSCLNQEACDVFIADGGAELCGTACDLRSAERCEGDGACALSNGICDYADHSPVGC